MSYIVVCEQLFGMGKRYYRGQSDEKFYTKIRSLAKRYKTRTGALIIANRISRLGAYQSCYVAKVAE